MKLVGRYLNSLQAWNTPESLEWLKLLSSGNEKAQEAELAMCKANRWYWMTHWVQTEDAQERDQPFRNFPAKPHLALVTEAWEDHKYLLIPKSRQMFLTWWTCALAVYESMFYPSAMIVIQSKKEEDSKANIKRCITIYDRLPKWMRQWQPMVATELALDFPRSRSRILGTPQGSQHVRGLTLTWMISDEAAYQDELSEVLGAAKPALGKNGRFTAISSAQPSYFSQLVNDTI